ncbi:MAG: polysaccharide pyruvyl transferase family protein [Candidatus Peribacteria bacterium]|nr:polysaccharide pyruvyl transferase family protein [Candidatus Peribacteria bacterium]
MPDLLHDLQTYTRKGYSLYFVPIAKGTNATYNDAQYYSLLQHHLQTFQQQTNHPPITFELLDREADFAYFVQTLKKADLVITTRLHLFLIASFLGVPTKVYPYQKKILKMQEVIRSLPFDLPNINEKAL